MKQLVPKNNPQYNEDQKKEEPFFIAALVNALAPAAKSWAYQRKISLQDTEELIHDAVLVGIRKLREDSFLLKKNTVKAYVFSVFKYLVLNHQRKKRVSFVPLADVYWVDTQSAILEYGERRHLLKILLREIGPIGTRIIELFYFQNYSDDEVIKQGMTSYTSVNALKSKRSQLLRKLRGIPALRNYFWDN